MHLTFKKFIRPYYAEYKAWFDDPELNTQLGPMDEDWLTSILEEDAADGVTWAVFDGDELAGVIETVFDRTGQLPAGITALAVKPDRRRQGIATAILQHIFHMHAQAGITRHMAYLHTSNQASRGLMEKAGFVPISAQPNEHGYIEYRRE